MSLGDPVIREAVAGDAPALTSIAREAKAIWGYDPRWLEIWSPQLTLDANTIQQMVVRIAELEGEPVGFVALHNTEVGWEIAHLWVRPAFARRGVGTRLLSVALALAKSSGALRVRVESDPHAEAFYLRAGAIRAGEIAAPMPGAEDRVLPVLEIPLGA